MKLAMSWKWKAWKPGLWWICYNLAHLRSTSFLVQWKIGWTVVEVWSPQTSDILLWRHNGLDGVSNHQPHGCLLNSSFRCRSKKISKLCVTGLCVGNSPVTGEFPAQKASNADYVSIWRRHHGKEVKNWAKQIMCCPLITLHVVSHVLWPQLLGDKKTMHFSFITFTAFCSMPYITSRGNSVGTFS